MYDLGFDSWHIDSFQKLSSGAWPPGMGLGHVDELLRIEWRLLASALVGRLAAPDAAPRCGAPPPIGRRTARRFFQHVEPPPLRRPLRLLAMGAKQKRAPSKCGRIASAGCPRAYGAPRAFSYLVARQLRVFRARVNDAQARSLDVAETSLGKRDAIPAADGSPRVRLCVPSRRYGSSDPEQPQLGRAPIGLTSTPTGRPAPRTTLVQSGSNACPRSV
jgi:hypothetical protein